MKILITSLLTLCGGVFEVAAASQEDGGQCDVEVRCDGLDCDVSCKDSGFTAVGSPDVERGRGGPFGDFADLFHSEASGHVARGAAKGAHPGAKVSAGGVEVVYTLHFSRTKPVKHQQLKCGHGAWLYGPTAGAAHVVASSTLPVSSASLAPRINLKLGKHWEEQERKFLSDVERTLSARFFKPEIEAATRKLATKDDCFQVHKQSLEDHGLTSRELLQAQLSRLRERSRAIEVGVLCGIDGLDGALGVANVGVVTVRPGGATRGGFEIHLSQPAIRQTFSKIRDDAFKPDDAEDKLTYSKAVERWAGVVAHEMLHNMGHRHPGRDFWEEYQKSAFEMLAFAHAVTHNGTPKDWNGTKEIPHQCGPVPKIQFGSEGGTSEFGGNGGSPFSDSRSGRSVLVGVDLYSVKEVDGLVPVFREVRKDGSLGPEFRGDLHGNKKGEAKRLLAPSGWVVTGYDVKAGSRVDGLQLFFSPWSEFYGTLSGEGQGIWEGGGGNWQGVVRLGKHEVATGIGGRAGRKIDAFRLLKKEARAQYR